MNLVFTGLKFIGAAALFIATVFFAGVIMEWLKKKIIADDGESRLSGILSQGFVLLIAVFELLGWFMTGFQLPTACFFILFLIVNIFAIAGGIIILKRTGLIKPPEIIEKLRGKLIWLLPVLLITVLSVVLLFIFCKYDADDSFYVSNSALAAVSDVLNPYDSSFGDVTTIPVPMYDFQIWETYIGMYCRLFKIDAATFSHLILPPLLFVVVISAYSSLGDRLFKGKDYRFLFVFFIILIFLMEGSMHRLPGQYLFSRLWQGKAVYLHIVMPAMLSFFLDKRIRLSKHWWLFLLFFIAAGLGLNPTSAYILGFEAIFLTIAWAIADRRPKFFLHLIPSVIFAMVTLLLVYMRTRSNAGQLEAVSVLQDNFFVEKFLFVFGGVTPYLVIMLICMVYVGVKGSRAARIIYIFVPLLLVILVLNPVMAPVIAANVTKEPTFWRAFWLLPVESVMAFTFADLIRLIDEKRLEKKDNKKLQKGLFAAGIIVIAAATGVIAGFGSFMFTSENGFVRAENNERIPAETLEIAQFLEAEKEEEPGLTVRLLGDDSISSTIRQKYTDIELVYSRYQYVFDVYMYRGRIDEAYARIGAFFFLTELDKTPADEAYGILEAAGADHVAVNREMTYAMRVMDGSDYRKVFETDNFVLFRR